AIGRLDSHSEGLLILTTNKKVTRLLFESDTPHQRTYLVQVKNVISEEKVQQLSTGVPIIVENKETYITKPCDIRIVDSPKEWASGVTEIPREYPHTWLEINLIEGKFHQVRKMVAAVGHPCRRLIRVAIEDLTLGNLSPGCVHEMEEQLFFHLLKIENYE
ncbi:MAG: pseudouridine synthase, partial [Leadbetterella sp.]|nr:pseudouridine synthase [Leadbetterella sp.]